MDNGLWYCKPIHHPLGDFCMARTRVSEEMWNQNPIIRALRNNLGPLLENDAGRVQIGCFKASATASMHHEGFSLRVNTPATTDGTTSIFVIKDGTHIQVPLLRELEARLPNHHTELAAYANLLERWGCELHRSPRKLPLLEEVTSLILRDMEEFAACAQALANPPAGSS